MLLLLFIFFGPKNVYKNIETIELNELSEKIKDFYNIRYVYCEFFILEGYFPFLIFTVSIFVLKKNHLCYFLLRKRFFYIQFS